MTDAPSTVATQDEEAIGGGRVTRPLVCVHVAILHYPLDTRILYRECRTLAAAGHEVHLVIADRPRERSTESNSTLARKHPAAAAAAALETLSQGVATLAVHLAHGLAQAERPDRARTI